MSPADSSREHRTEWTRRSCALNAQKRGLRIALTGTSSIGQVGVTQQSKINCIHTNWKPDAGRVEGANGSRSLIVPS